jgi:hypothetical protein
MATAWVRLVTWRRTEKSAELAKRRSSAEKDGSSKDGGEPLSDLIENG